MTAVSIAVIYLMRKLKQKCTDKPDMTWNDDLQMCVQQDCTNMCNGKVDPSKKGNCMPDNYCSGIEGTLPYTKYVFDPDSCGCTLSGCPSSTSPYAKNGDDYVIPDENGKIDTSALECGISCPLENITYGPGGIGWCPMTGYYCGNGGGNQHCLDDKIFKKCGDGDLYCYSGDECLSNPEGEYYCSFVHCGSKDENQVIACKINKNTFDSCGDSKAECKQDGKFSYYEDWGYCNHTNKSEKDPLCMTKQQYGLLSNYPHKCSNTEMGVNAEYQCNNTTACTTYSFCENGWQISEPEIDCVSTGESPHELNDYECCDSSRKVKSPYDGYESCCPFETTKSVSGKNICGKFTQYGYSKKYLGEAKASLNEFITCKSDSDCSSYNEILWKSLNSDGEELPKDWSGQEYKYVNMYCDPRDKVCKAICGYADGYPGKKIYDPYGVLDNNDSGFEHSFCYNNNPKCTRSKLGFLNELNEINGNLPLCTSDSNPKEIRWYPKKGDGYKAELYANYSSECEVNEGRSDLACRNLFANTDMNVRSVTNDPKTQQCRAQIACDQFNIPLPKGKSKKLQANELNMTLLSDPDKLDESGLFIDNASGSPIDFIPYYSYGNNPTLYYDPDYKGKTGNGKVYCGTPKKQNDLVTRPDYDDKYMKRQFDMQYCTDSSGKGNHKCTYNLDKVNIKNEYKYMPNGEYCKNGYNPFTASCYPITEEDKIEKFENDSLSIGSAPPCNDTPEVQINKDSQNQSSPITYQSTGDLEYADCMTGMNMVPNKPYPVINSNDDPNVKATCIKNAKNKFIIQCDHNGDLGPNCCTANPTEGVKLQYINEQIKCVIPESKVYYKCFNGTLQTCTDDEGGKCTTTVPQCGCIYNGKSGDTQCSGNGYCIQSGSEHVCSCHEGHFGDYCQQSTCNINDTSNLGSCTADRSKDKQTGYVASNKCGLNNNCNLYFSPKVHWKSMGGGWTPSYIDVESCECIKTINGKSGDQYPITDNLLSPIVKDGWASVADVHYQSFPHYGKFNSTNKTQDNLKQQYNIYSCIRDCPPDKDCIFTPTSIIPQSYQVSNGEGGLDLFQYTGTCSIDCIISEGNKKGKKITDGGFTTYTSKCEDYSTQGYCNNHIISKKIGI